MIFSKIVRLFTFLSIFPLLVNAQDFSKLYEQLNPSVVTVQTLETTISNGTVSEGGGLGTGILIDERGLIITAAHVVQSADAIAVKTYDGRVIEAEIVSSIPSADVALLKLKTIPKGIPVAKLGDSDKVKIGEQIIIIGNPFGLEHSLSIGHISGKQKRGVILAGEEMEFLQTDASINQGNSGGPMFNTKGELIGIVSSILTKSGGFDGVGFVAAINPARKILFEGSSFWTGFEGVFITDAFAKSLNVPTGAGVLVQRVLSNSIADKAGLKGGVFKVNVLGSEIWLGGDIILNIHKNECSSPHNFDNIKSQLTELSPGESIQMEVLRGGKVITLDMKFE